MLYHCSIVSRYYCIIVLLYHSINYCIIALLYDCIIVSLYYCSTVWLYYCITVFVDYGNIVLLYYCITVRREHIGAHKRCGFGWPHHCNKCWIVRATSTCLVRRVLQLCALGVSNCVRPLEMHWALDTKLNIQCFEAWLVSCSDGVLIWLIRYLMSMDTMASEVGWALNMEIEHVSVHGFTRQTTPCVLLVLCLGQARHTEMDASNLNTVSASKMAHSLGRPACVHRNTKPTIATVAANDESTS